MTTLKINKGQPQPKTPSQEIIEDANRIVMVDTTDGRAIGVGRINTSIRRRVFKILSPESAAKDRYLGMVFLAASVKSINGEDVRFPTSEAQFDALIDRLDDAGMEAVGRAISENFVSADRDEEVGE